MGNTISGKVCTPFGGSAHLYVTQKEVVRVKHRGFTLIELLVVIAIIAVLAAILFPVFAQAREKARQANCASNMRQLALAGELYLQDWGEYAPPRRGAGANYLWPTMPYGAWWQYTACQAVYGCPSSGRYGANPRFLPDTLLAPKEGEYLLGETKEGWDAATSAAFPHTKGANVAFPDGHVKWQSASQYYTKGGR